MRYFGEKFLAGGLGAFLVSLAVLKAISWGEIAERDLGPLYFAAGLCEFVLGIGLLACESRRRAWAWRGALAFCVLLFAFAYLARPLPDCKCFGALAEIGQSGRTVIAAIMCVVASLGYRAATLTQTNEIQNPA